MTIRELLVKINGDNSGLGNALVKAGQDLKGFQEAAKKTSAVFSELGKSLTLKVTAPIVAMGTAMVMSASEAEQASKLLSNAISAVGNTGKVSVANLQEYAAELQNITKYDDEATLSAFTLLEQMTALDEQGLKALMPSIQDLASAFNMDLQQAASLVGKTIGSNVNALGRYGIEVDAAATKSEKMAQVLQGLSRFQGAAAAEADTFAGRMAGLKNQLGDLAEDFGKLLLPVLSKAIAALKNVISWFSGLSTSQKEMILKVAGVAAALGPMLLGLGGVTRAVMGMSAAIKFLNMSALAGPFGLIALLAGSIVALISFAQNAKKAQDRLKDLYENPQNYGLEELEKQLNKEKKALAGIEKERAVQEASLRRQGASQDEITSSLERTFGAEKRLAEAARDRLQVEVDKKKAAEAAAKAQEAKDAAELEKLKKQLEQPLTPLADEATESLQEFNDEYERGVPLIQDYRATLINSQKALNDLEADEAAAAKKTAEFRKKVQEISATVVSFIGPLVELGTALGADAEDLAAFGAIATDAINGIAAAISGNIIGAVIAAIGLVTKLINLFKKKSEAAREAKRSTESYMDTVTSGEGKLIRFVNVIGAMFNGLVANFKTSFDKASLEALRTLTAFKELAASYGDSIGKTLGDAMIKGMSKVNFMAEIGKILINAMIAAALATGPIAAAMAAIGEKIAYMVVNGFTDEGMAEVEQMASDLYGIFSIGVLPIVQKIRDIFGQDSASEETGSFASGVTNFKGGIARVGEQGPETVRLPRGASVEPNGMRPGGISMVFNSPRALSPMETKRAMLAAGRQLAFETGGNF